MLEKFRPDAIYAFPSWFLEMADHVSGSGESLSRVRTLFTSSEVLTDVARASIERAFGGKVFDIYGSSEFKEVAWQCGHGRYHLNFESVYAEQAVSSDASRKRALILTSLNNRAMPLIRFRTGDQGRIREVDCACGRETVSIVDISGREVDMVVLPDGRRLSPYVLTTAIETHRFVSKYQLLQYGDNHLEVRYVPRHRGVGCQIRAELSQAIGPMLGPEMQVDFRELEEIPRTAGGKHRPLIRSAG